MSISLSARQKFRQRIQSIEKADEVHSLSFELAVNKIRALSNPIITQSIKKAWNAKLTLYFFNE